MIWAFEAPTTSASSFSLALFMASIVLNFLNKDSLVRILIGICGLHVNMSTQNNSSDTELIIEGETSALDMELAAKKNILSSINSMNADASLEAMNSLATKKVKTSSRDMLLLIRKFNISPNTTNPATIYQRPTKKKSGDDFPFTDKFPAATPI